MPCNIFSKPFLTFNATDSSINVSSSARNNWDENYVDITGLISLFCIFQLDCKFKFCFILKLFLKCVSNIFNTVRCFDGIFNCKEKAYGQVRNTETSSEVSIV